MLVISSLLAIVNYIGLLWTCRGSQHGACQGSATVAFKLR